MLIDSSLVSFISFVAVVLSLMTVAGLVVMCSAVRKKLKDTKKDIQGQSLKASTIETITDAVLGFVLSWIIMFMFLPLIYPNYASSASQSFGSVCIFTFFSVVRRFVTRRLFNFLLTIGILK